MKCCADFAHLSGFPGCCQSCHEDANEYGYSWCEGYGVLEDCEVCCSVASWLEANPEKVKEVGK